MVRPVVKVNKQLVSEWITKNSPLAREKWAVAAQVSLSTIVKLVDRSEAPKLPRTRSSVAAAIGVSESSLFPCHRMT